MMPAAKARRGDGPLPMTCGKSTVKRAATVDAWFVMAQVCHGHGETLAAEHYICSPNS